ncbi:Hypothetical predicted protein [Mytilus galloprovincialis]|uniref:Uncharacterized protein n=1 Tax=Mytilus galloprovincialis TaxID=29158 RepID=A0A8B6GWG8_MYTGA|nr:Hypothetical predicted protein [Mytilus galloprovincialis]
MNPPCAKCTKIVYPTEKLNCLDKIWHKGCFKCQSCNMTLNMKNYKGYNKFPYCNAHYPTTKPTQVADTPENRRIADNTKIQSNVKYHEDFERQKGKKMTVVDDPETQRVRQNTQNFSQVTYSGHKDQLRDMEYKRPAEQVNDVRVRPNPGSIHNYDPVRDQQQNQGTPYSSRNSGAVVYDSNTGRDGEGSAAGTQQPRNQPPPPQQYAQPPPPQEADRFSGKGMVCRAAYDYVAADDDEVSFNEGDHIIFCQPIDAGWMEGTVEATGRRGMLPSNYVETVKK